jgi:hypothetical protein
MHWSSSSHYTLMRVYKNEFDSCSSSFHHSACVCRQQPSRRRVSAQLQLKWLNSLQISGTMEWQICWSQEAHAKHSDSATETARQTIADTAVTAAAVSPAGLTETALSQHPILISSASLYWFQCLFKLFHCYWWYSYRDFTNKCCIDFGISFISQKKVCLLLVWFCNLSMKPFSYTVILVKTGNE